MALDTANVDGCLHCPPTHSAEASAHSAHVADRADGADSPCKTLAAQCTFVDDLNFDGRSLKVKDAPGNVPVAIAPASSAIRFPNCSFTLPDIGSNPYLPGAPPPRNIVYCIYLI